MDTAFFTGMSAFVSAMIVFVGSVFLLLALIVGARLAYFVTASITLGFVFIMAMVWSISYPPLGPVGQLPEWHAIDAQEDASQLDFDAASDYPDEPWRSADSENATETEQASELESAATEAVKKAISEGKIEGFPQLPQFAISEDSTRLLERGDDLYGATTIDVLPPVVRPELGIPPKEERDEESPAEQAPAAEPLGQVAVVAEYDPGNPLGVARQLALGTFIVFVLHLVGLSWSERRVARERAEATT